MSDARGCNHAEQMRDARSKCATREANARHAKQMRDTPSKSATREAKNQQRAQTRTHMSRFCTAAQLFGFMSASMSATAQPRPLTRRLPRRGRREAVLLAQEHEFSVRKCKKMAGFWQKNDFAHELLTKVAHPHPPSSPATESHQLRHLRPHQRLPCSRSRPMHPQSQPQPQRRPIRSCPRQPPPPR